MFQLTEKKLDGGGKWLNFGDPVLTCHLPQSLKIKTEKIIKHVVE